MKKLVSLVALLCLPYVLSSQNLIGNETPATQGKETPSESAKASLKEPFQKMTSAEISNTGIQKLTPSEQEALVKWWGQHKSSSHQHHISKEVSITSIANDGKNMILSDGSKISFSSSAHKKVSRWVVGDKLGLGDPGKRGSVAVYHMASGQKVKGKREQAPQNASSAEQKK